MLPREEAIRASNRRIVRVKQFVADLPREELEEFCRLVLMQRSQLAFRLSEVFGMDVDNITTNLPTDSLVPGFAYTAEELERGLKTQEDLQRAVQYMEDSN